MKIGDKVQRMPETFGHYEETGEGKRKKMLTGTVVYIHPAGRYHTVEFEVAGGKIRESFLGA